MKDDKIIEYLKEILELMLYEGDLQRSSTIGKALDLIKCYKAEIERLQTENKLLIENNISTKYPCGVFLDNGVVLTKTPEDYGKLIADISTEAIKEFAERLVAIYENDTRYDRPNAHTLVRTLFYNIDNIAKEMTEKDGVE